MKTFKTDRPFAVAQFICCTLALIALIVLTAYHVIFNDAGAGYMSGGLLFIALATALVVLSYNELKKSKP